MNKTDERFEWVEHLEEMRRRLIVILGALAAASALSFFFSDPLFRLLTGPIRAFEEKLYFLSPYEAFLVKLKISLFSGLVLSSPITFLEIWLFVAPGLYDREKKAVLFATLWTAVCFVVGIGFAFLLVAPFALRFFLGFQTPELVPLLAVGEYISFLTALMLAFGIAFVAPVFLLVLVKLGLVDSRSLARHRRLMIVLVFIVAALLTPSTDILSQILLALPLIVLFEISLVAARRMGK